MNVIELNFKVVKKVPSTPISTSPPPSFQVYPPPFLAKKIHTPPPQVTQFLESPTPPLIRGGGFQLWK